jgi:hypothetical protein
MQMSSGSSVDSKLVESLQSSITLEKAKSMELARAVEEREASLKVQ